MTNLTDLRPLTSNQYDQARAAALQRVQARIGEKPERKHFKREMGPLATPLDYIALVVFLAALAISSTHIIAYMTRQAQTGYTHSITRPDEQPMMNEPPAMPGFQIDLDAWARIHQGGAILLAESAALLFMTMHTMTALSRAHRKPVIRWFSIPLLLATLAAAFVVKANLESGIDPLVALMPPVFTLGIAVRLEALIASYLRRRDDISHRYLEALKVWEVASKDPAKHPEFMPLLRSELWQAIVKKNRGWEDAPTDIRRAAVLRELERETWAYDDSAVLPLSVNGHGTAPSPLNNPVVSGAAVVVN
ncbi:MAG: hypothetical protein KJ065_09180 [Anaerolineae bacterium]|nr:hypothetical protein [Anaerolineae bacterium]